MTTLGDTHPHPSEKAGCPLTAPGDGGPPSPRREALARFLLLAIWFGLLSGLGEVSLLAGKKFLLHRYVHQGPQVVWMAPLADLLVFATLGFVLSLLARWWPRFVAPRIAALVFAFPGFLGPLLGSPFRLSKYAAVLLAAGLAVQTARLVAAHPQGFYSLVRRTTGWVVALVVGLALGVEGWQGLGERRALAKLPPAAPDAPNVLLIVLDTVRAQSLSLYGYARPTTPWLEQFAKSGVRFERAIAPAPWTLPSHASMFTGRFPHELSAEWRTPLDATYPTLAEVLSARGYVTAGFVANIGYCSVESGLSRGFAHYEDYQVSPGQIVNSLALGHSITKNPTFRRLVNYHQKLGRKDAPDVSNGLLRWLSRQDRRPYFAFLNYFDAHDPYLPPKPFDTKFGPREGRGVPWRLSRRKLSPPEIQAELDAYEGTIAYLDHHLGLLFDELHRRGVLANTLVIITSDHGEQFGEHGVLMGHGNSLYRPVLHVPLLISFPSRVPAGKRVREPVTLRDLPATVLELLNLNGGAQLPGNSLARYWESAGDLGRPVAQPLLSEVSTPPRAHFPGWMPISKGNMNSLVVDRYHYIKNGDGREELYDLEIDPLEQHNLARPEAGRRELGPFRVALETILASD